MEEIAVLGHELLRKNPNDVISESIAQFTARIQSVHMSVKVIFNFVFNILSIIRALVNYRHFGFLYVRPTLCSIWFRAVL